MFGKFLAVTACGVALLVAGQTLAQPAAPSAYPPNDYADKANWLCWPGRDDACASDLTTTVIKADGTTSTEAFHADPNAPIDCFYVYPTVSRDPGMVSDMTVKPEETNVVIQQAARLRAHCRLYAPMYRQDTLAALVAAMMHPNEPRQQPQVGYDDVRDAWNYYLAHENHGRGVVLVGHSQGSTVLTALVKKEIDGKPAQGQLVSAILMGAVVSVPAGKDVGGDFKSVPLCHAADQLGCAIVYASFRETSPPPPTSFFARPWSSAPGLEAACVNPANLGGGSGAAESYFGALIAGQTTPPYPWLKGTTITTPFVATPGLITAVCVRAPPFHYLAIHLNADPSGRRTSDIPGDIVLPGGRVLKDWGLHLIDANLFMGNLVDIVGAEGTAWKAKGR